MRRHELVVNLIVRIPHYLVRITEIRWCEMCKCIHYHIDIVDKTIDRNEHLYQNYYSSPSSFNKANNGT